MFVLAQVDINLRTRRVEKSDEKEVCIHTQHGRMMAYWCLQVTPVQQIWGSSILASTECLTCKVRISARSVDLTSIALDVDLEGYGDVSLLTEYAGDRG